MNPLIVGEGLRQVRRRPDFGPGEWATRGLERRHDLFLEIIVGHHRPARPVPIRAPALRADTRLIIDAAARHPFVAAPLTPEAHDRDRYAGHCSVSYSAIRPRTYN